MSSKRRLNRQPPLPKNSPMKRVMKKARTDPLAALAIMEQEASHSQEDRTKAVLQDRPNPVKALYLIDDAKNFADHLIDVVHANFPAERPLACHKGCSYCCSIAVGASIPEVLFIARYLKETLKAEDLADVRRRIEEHQEQLSRVPLRRRLSYSLRCPLLVDGMCSVYVARPLACRGWNSFDAAKCQAFEQDPEGKGTTPVYMPQRSVVASIQRGVEKGLQALGLDHSFLELGAGLKIALDTPDAAERWLAGEPIFAPAALPVDEEDYRAALSEAREINRQGGLLPILS